MKKTTLFLALLFAAPLSHAQDYLYIMSARAQLLSDPVFGSKALTQMSKGEKVIEVKKTDNWFKVKYNGKIGWLNRLLVSQHPPIRHRHRLASLDYKLQHNARRRASNVSTTAAVRGLNEINRSRMSGTDELDYAALAKMEQTKFSNSEIYAFMDSISD